MDEARFIHTLIAEEKTTQVEIARSLGKSESTISKLLSVYDDEILRATVASDKLQYTSAVELLGRKPEEEEKMGHKFDPKEWQSFVDESLGTSAKKIRAGRQRTRTGQSASSEERECLDCHELFPEKSLKVVRLCTRCHAKHLKKSSEGNEN